MTTLDSPLRLANGDLALPLCLQAISLLLHEDIGKHCQGLEAHNGGGTHELVVIQAQFLLAITKKHFDVPPRRDVRQQRLRIRFQIAGRPVARLQERSLQEPTHDHDLATIELAHPRGHDMHVYLALASGPAEAQIVTGVQLRRIVRQALPLPALRDSRVFYSQPAIAFKASGDEKPALASRALETFGAVPTI